MLRKDLVLTKTIELDASPAKVWDALVNPEVVKQYFFGTTIASSWKEGEPVTFTGVFNGKEYKDKGVIVRIEPEKVLSYTYFSSFFNMEDKEENYSLVTYVISRRPADKVALRVTQSGFANEAAMEHSGPSWDAVLTQLKKVVEKG